MTQRERSKVEELTEAIVALREAVAALSASFEAHMKTEEQYRIDHRDMHRSTNKRIDNLSGEISGLKKSRDMAEGAAGAKRIIYGGIMALASAVAAVIGAFIGKSA
jgi:hypothetical protein